MHQTRFQELKPVEQIAVLGQRLERVEQMVGFSLDEQLDMLPVRQIAESLGYKQQAPVLEMIRRAGHGVIEMPNGTWVRKVAWLNVLQQQERRGKEAA